MNHGPKKTMKQNATAPALCVQFRNRSDQCPIDLTDAVVAFSMSKVLNDGSVLVTASGAAVVVDAANGIVEYRWVTGDTSETGIHYGIFSVTIDSKIEQFPNEGYIEIEIEDLAFI